MGPLSVKCLFSNFTPCFVVNIILSPKCQCSARCDNATAREGGRCTCSPLCQPLSQRAPANTHTRTHFHCLLKCIHLLSVSSLHGAPRLTQPCEDDTIIPLIRTALGAVWEQLGGVCTQTHTLAPLEICTVVVVVTLLNAWALFRSLPLPLAGVDTPVKLRASFVPLRTHSSSARRCPYYPPPKNWMRQHEGGKTACWVKLFTFLGAKTV